MPSTFTAFAPSLPSLPSYPSSTSSTRSAKRRANRHEHHPHQHTQYDLYYSAYPPTPIGSDDDPYDDDTLVDSIYSDSGYRSSLMAPTPQTSTTTSNVSRKRSYRDTGLEVDTEREGGTRALGGKRRILDLVGGAVRGVWSIITKPLPSFISGVASTPADDATDWIYSSNSSTASTYPTRNPHSFAAPLSPPPTPPSQREFPAPPVSVEMTVCSGYDLTPEQRALDAGLRQLEERKRQMELEMAEIDTTISQRWIMVPPPPRVLPHKRSNTWSSAPTNSGALHNGPTPRRVRTVSSCGRKRVFRSPRGSSLSGPMTTYPNRRTSSGSYAFGSSSAARDDDDMDMDEDMRRINDNLKKLIREGKEALGAKVEVVYDEDDTLSLDEDDLDSGFNYRF